VIELDGGQHALSIEDDQNRSLEIASHGYRVIRFWDEDVMENTGGVPETIRRGLEISLATLGGGEGRGEVGDSGTLSSGAPPLTLPVADATGPLPLLPKGRRGPNGG
jgi:hypothetical protein